MHNYSHRKHRELGLVNWHRNFDAALAQASESGKPILLLFQEVPGCSTCVHYGQQVLSNPLLTELIEDQFVPLAIFNNRQGHDADVLTRFNEASWNNPVVYFLDQSGVPLTQRLADCSDVLAFQETISAVLQSLRRPVPDYAGALHNDLLVAGGLSKALCFTTPCFWSGETSLAQHPAVLTTEAGWVDGEEVVRVDSKPDSGSVGALIEFASREGFGQIDGRRFERDVAPQYYLSKTSFSRLPLSPAQRTKINLAIPYRDRPERFLSQPQVRWLERPDLAMKSSEATYRGDFDKEWSRFLTIDTAAR